VSQDELHPEEGLAPPVDQKEWLSLLNEDGQLEDDLTLRKVLCTYVKTKTVNFHSIFTMLQAVVNTVLNLKKETP
jgi:hypothetical protein